MDGGDIMAIGIVRTAWSGSSGGPGLTQLCVVDFTEAAITNAQAQTAVNAVRAFWDAIKAYMPDEIVLTVSPLVDIYRETDGELIASTTAASAPASVGGTSTAVYMMASGMKVSLSTTTIRNGRRVRGAIYVVPSASTVYTASGTVGSAIRTAINTAGATMMSSLAAGSMRLGVYNRPVVGTNARAGAWTEVTGFEVNEKGAVLRGRRD